MTAGEAVARLLIVGGCLILLGQAVVIVGGFFNHTDHFKPPEAIGLGVMLIGAMTAFAAMFVTG